MPPAPARRGHSPGADRAQPVRRRRGRTLVLAGALAATAALAQPVIAQAATTPSPVAAAENRATSNGSIGETRATGVVTRPAFSRTFWPVVVGRAPGNSHDIPVPIGTQVRAVRDGIVVGSYDIVGFEPRIPVQNGYRSYGRVIKIRHVGSPGVLTYAHLSRRLVNTGDRVTAGQLIGLSGSTGHSFGPHLHIDWNGVENAVPWLYSVHALQPTTPWLR